MGNIYTRFQNVVQTIALCTAGTHTNYSLLALAKQWVHKITTGLRPYLNSRSILLTCAPIGPLGPGGPSDPVAP